MIDVLIVGAGPAGLTLACELARRGVSHRLVEKLNAPVMASKGKACNRARWKCSTLWGSSTGCWPPAGLIRLWASTAAAPSSPSTA